MALSDWSSTPASNATVLGVNIGEGCPPSNVNDAIRKAMADVASGINVGLLGTFLSSTTLGQAQIALGVSPGTTSLNNLGALFNAPDKIPYMTGSDGWSTFDLSRLLPIGSVVNYAAASVPSGFLECNGAAVSRATYVNLFNVVGVTFGAGDGSSTFNLPDLRGEFVRGYDNGRGIDSGRSFGSAQSDSVAGTTLGTLGGSHPTGADAGDGGTDWTVNAGGTETRPRNIALTYIIKY